MAALTAAFYTSLYHEEKSAQFQNFKALSSPIEFFSSEAAVHLLHLARELFTGMTSSSKLSVLINALKENA